ncbi:MAG: class I fructose-bisphosphate aldolase [Pseudomonadales bacterium]|nr:class I fructose-bisphosphate aldolase [Pseudomonadales bacterium]
MTDHLPLLEDTVARLAHPQRGILAADESEPTITKRFAALGIASTPETRRAWRSLLITTPGVAEYLSGVILFEETLDQRTDDGSPIVDALNALGIVPGIKVDRRTVALPFTEGEKVSQGLDDLGARMAAYRERGLRFAKWRSTFKVSDSLPSPRAIHANAEALARYAAHCQQEGVVPIVEPEVLIDGDYSIERGAEVTEAVLHRVFAALVEAGVILEAMVLKPNMVVAGKAGGTAPPDRVAEFTVRTCLRAVPAAVPTINFLSGGQSAAEATANLDAINRHADGRAPWALSFSFARALQGPAMAAWAGQASNRETAQEAFLDRARQNARARQGRWTPEPEQVS